MTDRGPQPPDDRDEVDRRFREIVAGLEPRRDQPSGERPTGASGTEAATDQGPDPAPAQDQAPDQTRAPNPWPSHLGSGTPEGMATDHRSYEPPEEDDHFVPPRPDPLPAGDLHFWAILVGLVAGPLLVFLSAIVPVLDRVWTFVGALLTITGFVLLVLRQPRHRRDDDWGARV